MAKRDINYGQFPNDRSGDLLRDAFIKCKENFDELYTLIGPQEATELGNFEFSNNSLRNPNGSSFNNSSAVLGATAYVNIPVNGSGDIGVLNYYGATNIASSATGVEGLKTWVFGVDGVLHIPGDIVNRDNQSVLTGAMTTIDGGNANSSF